MGCSSFIQKPTPRVSIKRGITVTGPDGPVNLNLFGVSKYILGYDKLGSEHEQWCADLYDVVTVQGIRKLLLLKPRGTFKSTVYTVALPIYLHLGDPTLRILIASSVGENAKRFLSEITGHYLRNDRLTEVYRQLGYNGCPVDPNASLVTSLRLTNCTKIQKEPNINTTGYGSSIVSQHYDVIIVDDIVDRSDRESDAVREGKKKWYRDLASLLEPDGLLLTVGTRWHSDDTYHHIIDELNPQHTEENRFHVEIEGAYMDEACTVARFPRILSIDKLEELKIDKSLPEFAANYMNMPLATESQIFKLGDMGFFDYAAYANAFPASVFGFCDPALGKKTGDYTTLITGSVSPSGTIYVLDAIIDRLIPDKAQELIIQQGAAVKYHKLGIETNGFQELFLDNIRKESSAKRIYLPLVPVTNTQNKQARIESIQPLTVERIGHPAVIRFRDDWRTAYPLLIDQLTKFPLKGAHDDSPDALAGLVELIRGKGAKTATMPYILGGGL